MKKYLFNYFLLALFLMSGASSNAQKKNIVISDALSENAEMMKVKMGTHRMKKMWNFRFGDYAIEKNKKEYLDNKIESNILNTKSEDITTFKFNFVLSNKTSDSAIVNALFSNNIKELHSFDLTPQIHFGSDEILKDSLNFTADISLTSDMDKKWKLFLIKTSGSKIDYKEKSILINGDRIISIIHIRSYPKGKDKKTLPALGYEFIENEQAICAMQYYGGGLWGSFQPLIWIDSSLNQKMKLILAATMTAILEIKAGKLN